MFRFTIREVVLLTAIIAMGAAWAVDHGSAQGKLNHLTAQLDRLDDAEWKLNTLVKLIQQRDGQVEFGDNSVSLYIVAKHWSAGPGWSSLERK